jgi:ATP-binding cassette, subfamily C, bacterial LapB
VPKAVTAHTLRPTIGPLEASNSVLRLDYILRRLSSAAGAPDFKSPVVRAVIASSVAINVLVLAVPLYINRIYTSVLPQKAGDSLLVITVLLLAVLLLDVILKTCRTWVLSWMGSAQEHQFRLGAIRSLLAAPLTASEAAPVNERLEQVKSAVALRSLFEQQWLIRRVDVPFVVVYLLVLAGIGGWLVLVPLLLVPVFIHQAERASGRIAVALKRKQQNEAFRDEVSLACLQGASTVKALNLEGFLVRRLEPSQETLSQSVYQLEVATAQLQNLSQLFAQWSQLLIVSFGGWLVINQQMSSGALAACTLLSSQVAAPLGKLFTADAQQEGLDLAQQRLDDLRQLPAEPSLLAGDPAPEQGELQSTGLRLPAGGVAVIAGGKPHQNTAWLESLTELRGEMPSDLTLAGQCPKAMERIQLRQRLRLVKHGSPLLQGTVLDQLTQFRSDQLGDQAAALCDRHGVAAEILALPHGYSTPIGEQQDFPLPAALVFRLQVMQALLDQPAVLMVDASEVQLPFALLQWVLALELDASRLIALQDPPPQALQGNPQRFNWSGDQLVEDKP